jgi:hypothetical protein
MAFDDMKMLIEKLATSTQEMPKAGADQAWKERSTMAGSR